jgi:hypothetical protein
MKSKLAKNAKKVFLKKLPPNEAHTYSRLGLSKKF